MRSNERAWDQLRPVSITRNYTKYAEGSVLVEFGQTKVLCNASVENNLPKFLKGKNQGWATAEYSMLPRATGTRVSREATRGKQSGRTLEIQRLIGRSLRAALDLSLLPNYTITVDCDVLQADGGTRTAAITGAMVAMVDALRHLQRNRLIVADPLKNLLAAVSVGICQDQVVLDLDYQEDSTAQTDMNLVMTDQGGFVEVQGTAEQGNFSREQLSSMMDVGWQGISRLLEYQRRALDEG